MTETLLTFKVLECQCRRVMAAGQALCAAPGAPTTGSLANGAQAAEPTDSWDYGAIDLPRLRERTSSYMQAAGASPDVTCAPCIVPNVECLCSGRLSRTLQLLLSC